ncbi:sensor histidine kinase [Micromonospora endolithica]|uniref:histidine kinase n=1 Tax=Micromonospora endolithica TaxID=230091 RepID=A0A3A9YUR5_9ACTN|nr:histidine kinase [Micromonospora endolithica]RKN39680.1 sensor histidine kinase [Micromonospora endolithica]
MTTAPPTHLAAALRRPGYLITAWPWRALAYLVTTTPVAGVLAVGLLVIVAPLTASFRSLQWGGPPPSTPLVVFLVVAGSAVVGLAPVVGVAVAALERWRLGLVDDRPVPAPVWRGVAARWSTAAGWREAGYTVWLATVVPAAYWLVLLLVALDVMLVVSPIAAGTADDVIVAWATVDTPRQATPYAVVGVLLVPVLWYGLGLLAAAQAAVARRLLGRTGDETALREVSRSRTRLASAYENERRRIERDVHDGAQPRLTSLSLQLGLARLDVPEDSPAARPLAVAHEQARGLMVLLRQIVQGIRPQSLAELGLAGAVGELAGESTVPVTVHADLDGPLPELTETTAYFVVSEALSNVARHADASRAQVRLTRERSTLVVEISDDGHGGADPGRGTGLAGLADRVAAANGRLLLASPAGGPTLVRVELPCRP